MSLPLVIHLVWRFPRRPDRDRWGGGAPPGRRLPRPDGRGGRWNDHCTVIDEIMFRIRTGIPWRDLPERYGSWKTVYERHRRRSADGTWDRSCSRSRPTPTLRAASTGRWPASTRRPAGPISTRPAPARLGLGSRKNATTFRHHHPDKGLGRSRGGLTCKAGRPACSGVVYARPSPSGSRARSCVAQHGGSLRPFRLRAHVRELTAECRSAARGAHHVPRGRVRRSDSSCRCIRCPARPRPGPAASTSRWRSRSTRSPCRWR